MGDHQRGVVSRGDVGPQEELPEAVREPVSRGAKVEGRQLAQHASYPRPRDRRLTGRVFSTRLYSLLTLGTVSSRVGDMKSTLTYEQKVARRQAIIATWRAEGKVDRKVQTFPRASNMRRNRV